MPKSSRLFFAIVPDRAQQTTLFKLAKKIQSATSEKITPANMLHITLRYIGPVDEAIKNCLIKKADLIEAEEFTVSLSKTGYWKKPQVTWLGPDKPDKYLLKLVEDIENICQQCGIESENRPYIPHLTLLRRSHKHLSCSLDQSIEWRVKKFVLIESVSTNKGVSYNVIKHWLLD